jgi:uncharacterized protein
MRVPIDQITAVPKRIDYAEVVETLNERLAQGRSGLRVRDGLAVAIRHYRAGLDVVVEGTAEGTVLAACGRCLDDYELPVTVPFRVILAPRNEEGAEGGEVDVEDLGLGFLEGDAVDVTAIVHEQLLLAVPTSRVCRASCRGLCPTCGANLNDATCACETRSAPPRLGVLQDLLRARTIHD